MKVLISCDEYCYRLNGKYYLGPEGILFVQRYLAAFEEICLALRTKEVNNKAELGKFNNLIPEKRVDIAPMPFFQGPIQYAKVVFKAHKAAKKAIEGCDMAIFRLPSTVGFVVWRYFRKFKKPYAIEVVFDCYDAYKSATTFITKLIWFRLHKKQVKACNQAVGVSCVTAEYLQKRYFPLGKSAITTNYSSIELPPTFYHTSRKFPNSKEFTIIHVANQVKFNSRKGHQELIRVLSKVRNKGINARLVFVGEDYDGGIARLTDMARKIGMDKHIEFTGFVQKDKLHQLLLDADVAVLPTKAEGLPRVIIEAMALGLPCITTPVSGNPELIDKELLIKYDDIQGFSDALTRILTNVEFYEEQSRKNYVRSLQYSTTVLNPRRTNFYKNLIRLVNSYH